ncbi:hypothetical protein COY07_00215, partial [Candidatus Peregrinibacteria bacterium CG_4_10_14_0_2_um_filter_43_11]
SLLGITSNEVEITNTVAATGGSSRPSRRAGSETTENSTAIEEDTSAVTSEATPSSAIRPVAPASSEDATVNTGSSNVRTTETVTPATPKTETGSKKREVTQSQVTSTKNTKQTKESAPAIEVKPSLVERIKNLFTPSVTKVITPPTPQKEVPQVVVPTHKAAPKAEPKSIFNDLLNSIAPSNTETNITAPTETKPEGFFGKLKGLFNR